MLAETLEVAVVPVQLPAGATVSPIAAVIRPPPDPIDVARDVTLPGSVHPVLPLVLLAQ